MARRTNRVAWGLVVVLALAVAVMLLKPYLPAMQKLRPSQARGGAVWNKFTPKTQRAIYFAQEEAARLGENYVGTEHLLLGLLRERDNVAVRVLERLNVSPDALRADLMREVARGHGNLGVEMQLSVQGKKAVDLAIEEAQLMDHDFIGTGHLLLGVVGNQSAPAGEWLAKRGIKIEPTRRQVSDLQDREELPASP